MKDYKRSLDECSIGDRKVVATAIGGFWQNVCRAIASKSQDGMQAVVLAAVNTTAAT